MAIRLTLGTKLNEFWLNLEECCNHWYINIWTAGRKMFKDNAHLIVVLNLLFL